MGTIPVSNEMTVYSWALVTLLCVQHKKKTAHGKLFIPPSVITLTEWLRWSAEGMHMHSVITRCPALCTFYVLAIVYAMMSAGSYQILLVSVRVIVAYSQLSALKPQ
jgi:hypothetical protein